MSLSIAPDALNRLRQLHEKRKFTEEELYPGAPTEEIRSECERRVNGFLDDVVDLLQRGAEAEDFFARARALNETFTEEDTEEREKVEDYIGETMRIIGLENWTEHV